MFFRRRARRARGASAHGVVRDFPVRHRAFARAHRRAHALHARVQSRGRRKLGRALRRGVPGDHNRDRHGGVGASSRRRARTRRARVALVLFRAR